MSYRQLLNADPLPWLLEDDPANPGVRLRVLIDLLGRRPDDPEVAAARRAVMTSGPVPVILDAQSPAGEWVKPGSGYSPKYRATVWQIMFLAELGADPADARVRRGCDYLLQHAIAVNGAFSAYRQPVPSGAIHCLNGNLLAALLEFGYFDDPRVQGALDWQARAITGEEPIQFYRSGTTAPGFACVANQGQPCAWGATKAMKGLAAVPPRRRTPAVQRAIDAGAEFLLGRDLALADYPYTGRVSSTWFKLGFPLSYWSDVLETATVLADLGYADDPRLANALRLILAKQDALGRWRLENTLAGKMWVDIEVKRQPSKWVTLRVLRMLAALQPGAGS